MGGDLPDDIVQDAPFADYARDLGPQLAEFSHDVRQEIDHSSAAPNAQTTYLGHSYGGAVVGRAELAGLDADRVLHVESAGMGHDVQSPDDLPDSQDDVDRYSMTAPGDVIGDIQGMQLGDNIGHAGRLRGHGLARYRRPGRRHAQHRCRLALERLPAALRCVQQHARGAQLRQGHDVSGAGVRGPPLYPYPGWVPEQTGWHSPVESIDIE